MYQVGSCAQCSQALIRLPHEHCVPLNLHVLDLRSVIVLALTKGF